MKELLDLRTGEPVIDFNGNIVETNIDRAFNQYMDVMLHTPIFEEIFLLSWGIPIREIFQLSFNANWENMVKYYMLKAINPRTEPLINEVKSIEVERDGTTVDISFHVTSKYGTKSETEVSLIE